MSKFYLILSTFVWCLFLSNVCHAQDKIYLYDSHQIIEAKVIEISDDDVLYKMYNNLDGPDYRISKAKVVAIEFENGTKQFFTNHNSIPYVYYHDGYLDYRNNGYLDYRNGHFYREHRRLSQEEIRDAIGYSLYGSRYRKAMNQYSYGFLLTLSGTIAVSLTTALACINNDYRNDPAFQDPFFKKSDNTVGVIIGYVVGAACLGSGIPLWIKGNRNLNAIADDFNSKYSSTSSHSEDMSLILGKTSSGFGLALNF